MGWSCPAVWFSCTVVDYTNWDYFVLLGTEGAAVQQGEGRGRELLIHCSCLNNPITSSSPFLPKGPLSISRPAMGSLLLFSCPLRLWQQQKRVLGLVGFFFSPISVHLQVLQNPNLQLIVNIEHPHSSFPYPRFIATSRVILQGNRKVSGGHTLAKPPGINHTMPGVFFFAFLREISAEYGSLNFGREEKCTCRTSKRSHSSAGNGGRFGLPKARDSIYFQKHLLLKPVDNYGVYGMETHGIES